MQNLLVSGGGLKQSIDCCMQMQRYRRFDSFPVLEELGSYSEIGKTTKHSKPKRSLILLEAFRMRDLQVNVPLHLQDLTVHLQDYRSLGANEQRQQLYSLGVDAP